MAISDRTLTPLVRRDHRGGIGDLVFVEAEYNKDEVRKTVTMRHEEGFHAIPP